MYECGSDGQVHVFGVKMYIPVVFKLLVWCGAEGYVSGLQDAALLTYFVACMLWVTEGQLKKRVRVIWALFGNQFACLVEELNVELLKRE